MDADAVAEKIMDIAFYEPCDKTDMEIQAAIAAALREYGEERVKEAMGDKLNKWPSALKAKARLEIRAEARSAALEEAAKIAQDNSEIAKGYDRDCDCADKIRSLMKKAAGK